MKKIYNIFIAATAVLSLASCSKESPFDPGDGKEYGGVSTSALRVELQNEKGVLDINNRPTRAGVPDTGEFTVTFIKEGETIPEVVYKYSEMPEVVTLPKGTYIARATYGDNPEAAWESPYYYGESESFNINADEITELEEPIVCGLNNVRVSIIFGPTLLQEMSDDCVVTVKVGESGSIDFTKDDTQKSAYFAYYENSKTLAATFHGNVEGYPTSETKAYDKIAPGNHYRITFRLRMADQEDPGDINSAMTVDASVEIVDMNGNIDIEDDPIVDDMRPIEGEDKDPDNPDDPVDTGEGPVITAKAPLSFDNENIVTNGMECEFYVHSEKGIETLTVDIDSSTLTAEELEGVGLTKHLDLVTPGQYEEGLHGLGFPVNVAGKKDLTFNITEFMPMLQILGAGTHKFIIKASDGGGKSNKTLILITK